MCVNSSFLFFLSFLNSAISLILMMGWNPRGRLSGFPLLIPILLLLLLMVILLGNDNMVNAQTRIDEEIRDQQEGGLLCISYEDSTKTFTLECPFRWKDTDYPEDGFILLKAHEIFDGNDLEIDLDGLDEWDGLFRISQTATNLQGAPVIKYLHIRNGATSTGGGFVVQEKQHNFIVEFCTSSGKIRGQEDFPHDGGGGICGQECSGEIVIRNCYSTGKFEGRDVGGIAGKNIGQNMGNVTIENCYSTGAIAGRSNGGICGAGAGSDKGYVSITHSYSTGVISTWSGGICGWGSGIDGGFVHISQCYSLGNIGGKEDSGGITGRATAASGGHTVIEDSYSRGDIQGTNSGGICGTIGRAATTAITNVYASGQVSGSHAGGTIGARHQSANLIKISMSVHNQKPLIGSGGNFDNVELEDNSNDISTIHGRLYCSGEPTKCWNDETVWKAVPDDLPILQAQISPLASPTPSRTPSSLLTLSLSPTVTQTNTITMMPTVSTSDTETPTSSPSMTTTSVATPSPSSTHTCIVTVTPTFSGTNTQTTTSGPSSSMTFADAGTWTPLPSTPLPSLIESTPPLTVSSSVKDKHGEEPADGTSSPGALSSPSPSHSSYDEDLNLEESRTIPRIRQLPMQCGARSVKRVIS